MLREFLTARSRALIAPLLMLICVSSNAQTALLNEVHTIADVTKAVPVEHSFDISLAGTYQVTLVDLGAQLTPSAPLASVKLAITDGSTVVGTPLTAAGSTQFTATGAATYVIHVVGAPGPQAGSGPIGIQITNVSGNTPIASFSDTLAVPSASLPSNEGTLDDTFTVASSGSYVVTLADLKLPQSLTTVVLKVTMPDGTLVTNPPLVAAGSTTVPLQQGVTYRIFGVAVADATANAGLYSATVTPAGGGAAVYNKAVPVGTVAPINSVSLNGGGSYTLSLADLSYPNPLTHLAAVVTTNGQIVAQLAAAGTSQPFASVSGTYQVFATASTAATGSYAVTLAPQSGPPALSLARAVSASGATIPSAYSFDATVTTAGSYAFDLSDFAFPNQLASLSAVAVQNGAVLGQPLSSAGTQNVTVAAGSVSLLVFALPGTAGSLFGLDLTAGAGATPIFETNQGVGQLFSVRQVSVTTAGNYAVTVSDVGFPASLATFAVLVTRGTTQVGSIFGGGTFTFSAGTTGNYLINFIAQPGGTDKAGTYAMNVRPGPDVTLKSDVATVASGGTVNLTWTSQNTATCTASGGWSGSQTVSGTMKSAALTANTTFTLTCSDGQGATAAQSVSVNVSPLPAGNGGGGALNTDLLLLLSGVMLLRLWWSRRIRG